MGCCGGKYDQPKELTSKHWPKFFEALPRMEGKVVAVTGCTSGTGYVCVKACAQLGAQVVMLNRASERSTAAETQIRSEVPDAKVSSIPCDLQTFDAVRKAAEMLKEQFGETGLDVLCNNAGVMALSDEATPDGCDVQMQTNHLSHFLLTCEVWPLLDKAASLRGEARVVNHTSIARRGVPLDKKYLGKNGGSLGGNSSAINGPRWARYHQSKLANMVFTYALRDRANAANSKVKSLLAHPGVSATSLQVKTVADKGMSSGMAGMIVSQSAEDGAIGLTLCCCQPDLKSGDFYGPKGRSGMKGMAQLLPPGPEEKLADQAARDLLWEESQATTGATFTIPSA